MSVADFFAEQFNELELFLLNPKEVVRRVLVDAELGMPKGRSLPPGFGIITRRTGADRYVWFQGLGVRAFDRNMDNSQPSRRRPDTLLIWDAKFPTLRLIQWRQSQRLGIVDQFVHRAVSW
jgi:hypothetical protein